MERMTSVEPLTEKRILTGLEHILNRLKNRNWDVTLQTVKEGLKRELGKEFFKIAPRIRPTENYSLQNIIGEKPNLRKELIAYYTYLKYAIANGGNGKPVASKEEILDKLLYLHDIYTY